MSFELSEREAWVRLCLLREAAVIHCCRTFLDLWNSSHTFNPHRHPWEDIPENGESLWSTLMALAVDRDVAFEKHEESFIRSGNTETWEFQILGKILKCLGVLEDENPAAFCKAIFVGILKQETCDKGHFQRVMKYVVPLLEARGFEESDVFGKSLLSAEKHLKVMDVVRKGNMLQVFERKNEKAIEVYGEAIGIADDPKDETLVIANILLAAFDLATTDERGAKKSGALLLALAKRKVEIQPDLWQSHFDLGRVHKLLDNHVEAGKAFEKALELNPIRTDILTLKHELDNRQDPVSLISLEEILQMANREIGMNMKPEFLVSVEKQCKKSKSRVAKAHGFVMEGNRYEQGFAGTKVDLKKAAEVYAVAVDYGSAEAMYHLSRLYRDGRGVKKDLRTSATLLQKAVKVPDLSEEDAKALGMSVGDTAPGVACAMLALGEYFDQGTHFPKNDQVALQYFMQAVEKGNDAAGFHVGNYYAEGKLVDRDMDKAAQYWKLAADIGHGLSMIQMAEWCLEELGDIKMAREWFRRAKENGVMERDEGKGFNERIKQTQEKLKDLKKMEDEAGITAESGAKIKDRFARAIAATSGSNGSTITELVDLLTTKSTPHPQNNTVVSRIDYKTVRAFAEKGYRFARQMASAFESYNRAVALILVNEVQRVSVNDGEVVHELAEFFRSNCEFITGFTGTVFVNANAAIKRILNNPSAPKEQQIDARICYLSLNLNNLDRNFASDSVKKFPMEVQLWIIFIGIMAFRGEYGDGAKAAKCALVLFPDNLELLFVSASSIRLSLGSLSTPDEDAKEAISQFERFIKFAPRDHRKVPEAYYCISYLYYTVDSPSGANFKPTASAGDRELAQSYFSKGLTAEKDLTPCFLPYDSVTKKSMELFLKLESGEKKKTRGAGSRTKSSPANSRGNMDGKPAATTAPKAVSTELSRGPHSLNILTDPTRIKVVIAHRKQVQRMREASSMPFVSHLSIKPAKTQTDPTYPKTTKSITLREMDATKDRVYTGCHLKLTLIENGIRMTALIFVVEDENGDVQRFCAYNLEDDGSLVYGAKITLFNPYLRIAADGLPVIRVDDPSSIVCHPEESNPDRCRFCGSGSAGFKCGKCHKAKYCTKECQLQDWTTMKHYLICFA